MHKIIDKKIYDFYTNKIGFVYILFLLLVSILSLIFTYYLILKIPELVDKYNNIVISNIPFGYGALIENLYKGNGYVKIWNGTDNYLSRLPFLPIFETLILKLTLNIYAFLLIKNLILFSLYFYFAYFYSVSQKKSHICFLIIISIVFCNFYNLTTNLNFIFADAFIGIFLPIIFLILSSNLKYKNLMMGLILFFLYLTKTTMFFPTLTISIIYIYFEKDSSLTKKFLPLIFLIIAMIIWGTFAFKKTGVFAYGPKISSDNQEALNIVMNKDFHKYYPKASVDLIPKNNLKKVFENEWDNYEYYKKLNEAYFQNNRIRVLKDTLIKIKFIFFNIRKDSVFPDINGQNNNPIMISHILNRIVTILSIMFAIFLIVKNFNKIKYFKLEFYFLAIFFSSIFPHLIGWATSKHLVGIFIICHIYLFLKLKKYFLY